MSRTRDIVAISWNLIGFLNDTCKSGGVLSDADEKRVGIYGVRKM